MASAASIRRRVSRRVRSLSSTSRAPKLRTGPLAESAIVFCDRDVVVVDKPAGMLSVADEPGNKETIVDYTRTLLRRMGGRGVDTTLGVVHRLDKDTSGLMVFARTAHAKRALAAQFREHAIDRVYHAIAHGAVTATRVETYLVLDRGDGMRGSHRTFPTREGRPLRSTRSARSRTSDRSPTSRAPRWSNVASKPDASIRFESTCPSSAIRWSANACTSATTPARRSKQRARCSMRGRSDSCIPEPPSASRSSANRPTTSRRRSNRFDRLAASACARPGAPPAASEAPAASVRGGVGLPVPAAPKRLREIDDRQPRIARRRDAQSLGGEQRALRIQHLEVRRAAGFVAQRGDCERLASAGRAAAVSAASTSPAERFVTSASCTSRKAF